VLKPHNPKRNHAKLEEMNLAHVVVVKKSKNVVVDRENRHDVSGF
jgi:hypothetical protein